MHLVESNSTSSQLPVAQATAVGKVRRAGARRLRRAAGRVAPDAGFTIIEVLIAMTVLTIVCLGVAQLFGVAILATHGAKSQTSAATLAEQKMEQLRALTWGFDSEGDYLPVSDTSTNLSVMPAASGGGGLNPSPTDSLDVNTAGYVDYLDKRGQWIGTGVTAPAAAIYIRRWRIMPLPTNPNNTLILQVLVTPSERERTLTGGGTRKKLPNDALISTVKTRKAN